MLALTALAYAGRLGDTEPPEDIAYRYSYVVAALVQYAVMLGILLLIARGLPGASCSRCAARPRGGERSGSPGVALVAIYGVV